METIPIYKREEKAPQKPKEPTLLERCKYYNGEDKNPFKDEYSPEGTLWDLERIAVREAGEKTSIMLTDAASELEYVKLPEGVTETVPAPVLQVAYVHYGKQMSTPHNDPSFAVSFTDYLGWLYGSNFV